MAKNNKSSNKQKVDQLRVLAIALLNNDNGINQTAWDVLSSMLVEAGHKDIVEQVEAADEHFYLPEDFIT